MRRPVLMLAAVFAAFALTIAFVASPTAGLAQDATPEGIMADAHLHPAHIHAGTCEELGDVVFPLEDVSSADLESLMSPSADPNATPDPNGDDEAIDDGVSDEVVAVSVTTIDASFDEIFAADHAINIHESAENIGNYIACGDLTEDSMENDELRIDLEELNDSGFEGTALLVDNGEGQIEVTIELMQTSEMMDSSPEATPTS